MTASPGFTYTNDVLGNLQNKVSTSTSAASTCTWDDLNRMTGINSGLSVNPSYAYRADGLRVSKSLLAGATQYRYDGQMGVEDVEKNTSGAITAVSRMALGGRGVDAISRTTSSGTSVSYPLYDTHGNNVGMLAKSGATWSISDERTYDAWGLVRSGGTTGDQKGRYCASIGHKQDDESGLIYMRARYYEPSSGRFVTEDTSRQDSNWFTYCSNSPTNASDSSGKSIDWDAWLSKALSLLGSPAVHSVVTAFQLTMLGKNSLVCKSAAIVAMAGLVFLISWFAVGISGGDNNGIATGGSSICVLLGMCAGQIELDALTPGESASVAAKGRAVVANYSIILLMFIRLEFYDGAA